MNKTIVSELAIYPVKSCKGLALEQMFIGKKGPHMDRRWMVVDEKGVFISQRSAPKLAMVHTALDDRFLFLSVPAKMPFMLGLNTKGSSCNVTIWQTTCMAYDMGDDVAFWLSDFISKKCRLVFLPDESRRQIKEKYDPDQTHDMGFADRLPLLLVSEASLTDLSERLGKKIRMNRFRPNIVVKTEKPYEEDTWKRIQIGALSFRQVKPCIRCIVPAIDQETTCKTPKILETLAGFRKKEEGVAFGQLLVPEEIGTIFCGDTVTIVESYPAQS